MLQIGKVTCRKIRYVIAVLCHLSCLLASSLAIGNPNPKSKILLICNIVANPFGITYRTPHQ